MNSVTPYLDVSNFCSLIAATLSLSGDSQSIWEMIPRIQETEREKVTESKREREERGVWLCILKRHIQYINSIFFILSHIIRA